MGWTISQIRNRRGLRVRPPHSRPRAAAAGTAAAISLVSLIGCASDVPRRTELAAAPGGGGSAAWETVFLAQESGDQTGGASWGNPDASAPEFGRRDASLNGAQAGPLLATAEWPEPARTTIERSRVIFVRDSARRMTFFLPERTIDVRRDWWLRGRGGR